MYSEKIKLETIKQIVNKHDPVGLIAIGAPQDEYGFEIKSIYDTISQNELSMLQIPGKLEETLKKIFIQTFGAKTIEPFLVAYREIADDLLMEISKNVGKS